MEELAMIQNMSNILKSQLMLYISFPQEYVFKVMLDISECIAKIDFNGIINEFIQKLKKLRIEHENSSTI
jgi:hypothetical protein